MGFGGGRRPDARPRDIRVTIICVPTTLPRSLNPRANPIRQLLLLFPFSPELRSKEGWQLPRGSPIGRRRSCNAHFGLTPRRLPRQRGQALGTEELKGSFGVDFRDPEPGNEPIPTAEHPLLGRLCRRRPSRCLRGRPLLSLSHLGAPVQTRVCRAERGWFPAVAPVPSLA